jgi:hypothetical protein
VEEVKFRRGDVYRGDERELGSSAAMEAAMLVGPRCEADPGAAADGRRMFAFWDVWVPGRRPLLSRVVRSWSMALVLDQRESVT